MRDNFDELTKLNVKIFGVSTDSAESHKAFIAKHNLPFPLVVDDGAVTKAFSVDTTMGYAARNSFLIAPDGKVAKVWRDVNPETHAPEVIAAVQNAG